MDMNRQGWQETEEEVDLVQLMAYILRRWRLLTGLFVLGLILGAGIFFAKYYTDKNSSDYEAQLEEYESMQNLYEEQTALYESRMEEMEGFIRSEQYYLDNSIYINLDPFEKAVAEETFSVLTETEEEAESLMDPADVIVGAYYSAARQADLSKVCDIFGTEESFARELVNVSVDYSANTVTISVAHSDLQAARAALELLADQTEAKTGQIAEKYGRHTLVRLRRMSGYVTDMGILNARNGYLNQISGWQNSIQDSQTKLDKLEEPKSPVMVGLSKKKLAAYMVLGGLLLPCAAAGIYMLIFMFAGAIYTADDIRLFPWAKRTAVFPAAAGKKRFLSCIDRLVLFLAAGRNIYGQDMETELRAESMRFARTLGESCQGKKLVVAGIGMAVDAECGTELSAIKNALETEDNVGAATVSLACGSDVFGALEESDMAVAVIRRGKVSRRDLEACVQNAELLGCQVAGYILL